MNVNKTVIIEAIIGRNLNHNCEVDILEVNGNHLSLFLILICNQNIDIGYINFAYDFKKEGKKPLFVYKK